MLTRTIRTMTVAVALALGAILPAAAAGPNGPGTPVVAPYVAPTAVEVTDMTYMREEEKMARDLYLRFAEAWDILPFDAIASSEQNHMDAMLRMLIKYRVADPAAGNLVGEFTDPELQALYTKLLAEGFKGPVEALKVGGLVEEVDLIDLREVIAQTTKEDLRRVYSNLLCGSRNHLRAFAANIRAVTGESYAAQVLPQQEVDAVLAVSWERCGRTW